MAKDNISQYSTTAASNTDVGGVNINEDCLPSNLNNAIRELMSHLADLNAGNTSLGTVKVDNLQLDLNTISSTDTNGNINITPNGTGSVVIDGLSFPQADGTADQVLKTNGSGQISFGDAESPFAYNAVTGTTPSLDVGTYNFFNQGTLTGNTTVSFTNVPTEAQWSYTFEGNITGGYDIGGGSYTNKSFDLSSQSANNWYGFYIGDSGTKMYVMVYGGGTVANALVYQYNLSTAYDISTASYASKTGATGTIAGGYNLGFTMSTDGTKAYVNQFTGGTTGRILQYTLSTAWDISTMSYASKLYDYSALVGGGSSGRSIKFKPDGTKAYIVSVSLNRIFQVELSTAWDISTASYSSTNYTTSTSPFDLEFNSDGTKAFVNHYIDEYILQYSLSTAWDVSTMSSDSTTLDYSSQSTTIYYLSFSPNGGDLFLQGDADAEVYQYLTGAIPTLTLPSSVKNTPLETVGSIGRHTYEFWTADGGTNVYISNEEKVI